MSKRNKIRSITPTMWQALGRLCSHGKCEEHAERCRTLDALERRELCLRIDVDEVWWYAATTKGRDILDAYKVGAAAVLRRRAEEVERVR